MQHNHNEQSPMVPANVSGTSNSQQTTQAPPSLIPSVLKHLEQEQASLPPGTTINQLVAALHDTSWNVRARAAFLLGEMGEQIPVEPLIAALQDEDATVRVAVVRALGKLGTRAPLDQLNAALHDPDWMVQEIAAFTRENQEKQKPEVPLPASAHNTIEEDSDIDNNDDYVQISPLPVSDTGATLRSTLQHPAPTVPKRQLVQRIMQGVVAALLIAGIAISWLAIAQRLHPTSGGVLISKTAIPSHPKQGTVLFTYHTPQAIDYPIWSNDNRYMTFVTESSGNDSANVYVWNATTEKLTKVFSFAHLPPKNWSYSSDGINFLLTRPGKLQIWNAITGRSVFVYADHSNQQPNFSWSNDSKFLAVALNKTTMQIWNVFSGQISLTFPIDIPSPYSFLMSPVGTRIFVQAEHFEGVSNGGIVGIYDAKTGRKISTIIDNNLIAIQWSPDGKYLLSEDLDLSTYALSDIVWDAATGSRLSTHTHGSQSAYFLCTDQRLNAVTTPQSQQQILDIWDARTGKTIFTLHLTNQQWQFSNDCKYIALYSQKDVQIMDVTTGRTMVTHHTSAVIESVGFSNTSSFIASASRDNMLQVWDAATGGIYYTYHVTSNAINIINWSPDDKLIATTSSDNIVQVLQVS